MLFIRDVPSDLYGRQRAEFKIYLNRREGGGERIGEALVKVDLVLPQHPSSTMPMPSPTPSNEGQTPSAGISTTTKDRSLAETTLNLPDSPKSTDTEAASLLPTPVTQEAVTIDQGVGTTLPTTSGFPHNEYTAMLPEGR